MNVSVIGIGGFIEKNFLENLKNIKDGKDKVHQNIFIDSIRYFDGSENVSLTDVCENTDYIFDFTSYYGDCVLTQNFDCNIVVFSPLYSFVNTGKTRVLNVQTVFGKWCDNNENNIIASICKNISNQSMLDLIDKNKPLQLVYVDDLVEVLLNIFNGCNGYNVNSYSTTVGEVINTVKEFTQFENNLTIAESFDCSLKRKLYSTFISYMPKDKVCVPLKTNVDERGGFTELIKTLSCGQLSVNVSKPDVTKGQHWHNGKWELFIVVSGNALIEERKIGSDEVLRFEVSGDELKAVYMLPGYTHNIINLSKTQNLVTLMWSSERFNVDKPDTYSEKV